MLIIFKQETAYEVRIRYWSSYVCSSDLHDFITIFLCRHMRRPTPLTPTLGDRVPKQVKIEVSHKKNLQMRGTAVMRPRPTQPFDTPPPVRLGREPAAPSPAPSCADGDRKSTRLNSSHSCATRMPSSS